MIINDMERRIVHLDTEESINLYQTLNQIKKRFGAQVVIKAIGFKGQEKSA